MTGLADAVAVQAHEVGDLAAQVAEENLRPGQTGVKPLGQREKGVLIHSPPPKTATSRKRQGGEAWPT